MRARLEVLAEEPQARSSRLEISEVRVRLYHARGGKELLRGFATITLNGCFAVHNLKVIEKDGEFFVAMPARRNRDGRFSDIAHPINQEFRQYMESVILTEYERERAAIL